LLGVEEANHRQRRLLRARRERPSCCTAEHRDEIAPFQMIELHSVLTSRSRIAGYRIGDDQSAGVPSYFTTRWRSSPPLGAMCGHGSSFHNCSANDWVGRVIGVLTLAPYDKFLDRTRCLG
jgi:hypothetical protein